MTELRKKTLTRRISKRSFFIERKKRGDEGTDRETNCSSAGKGRAKESLKEAEARGTVRVITRPTVLRKERTGMIKKKGKERSSPALSQHRQEHEGTIRSRNRKIVGGKKEGTQSRAQLRGNRSRATKGQKSKNHRGSST